MASSGSKSVAITSWDTLKFSWSQKSQNIANNTTTISWTLQLIATEYGYISSSASKAWTVTVNGTKYSGTTTVGINNNSTKTLASGTTTIAHAADGSKSFNYSFSQVFDINFNGWVGTISGSGSGTLNTIPRKSSLTTSTGTLGTAMTLTISAASSSFKHKIQYSCGSYSGYAAGSASAYASSLTPSWTPPLTLANTNTTGTNVTVKLTLYTYASDGTSLGNEQKTIYCTIPATVKPSCSFTLEDVTGIDDIYGSPVQGLSKIKITVNPTLAYSSPIASYAVTCDGTKYTTQVSTTGALKNSGDSVVTATVKDKRGRTGSVSYTMKVQAYNPPNVTKLTATRCNQDGTANDRGAYIKVVFSAVITPLNSINTADYELRFKKVSADTYSVAPLRDLDDGYKVTDYEYIFNADVNSAYDVEVTAQDSHGTTTRSTTAATAFSLINWGANGTSMAIGKTAERANSFEVALDSYFTGPVIQQGNRYCFSSAGVGGSTGYVLVARIAVTAANADTPITFVLTQRQQPMPMRVYVQLKNSSATTSEVVSVSYEGSNYDAYIAKTGALTYELYVKKSNSSDTVSLQEWYSSPIMQSRVSVTFIGTQTSTVPTPYYKATPAMMRSLLDYIYPVGSIYMSYTHNNPADLFGGSWTRIENRFLWGTTSGGTIGLTGGEASHVLTLDEIPAHNHQIAWTDSDGDAGGSSLSNPLVRYGTTGKGYSGVTTYNAGGGGSHNNMPPYIQVSIWRRTA